MTKQFFLSPVLLLLLTGCMNNLIDESTNSINANAMAIQRSTEVIHENAQLIEESNKVVAENQRLLKQMSGD
jgi:hypothetical protein